MSCYRRIHAEHSLHTLHIMMLLLLNGITFSLSHIFNFYYVSGTFSQNEFIISCISTVRHAWFEPYKEAHSFKEEHVIARWHFRVLGFLSSQWFNSCTFCVLKVCLVFVTPVYIFILISCLLNLLCGAGNFGKIWCACRQHEIQYVCASLNDKNILMITEHIYEKMQFTT